MVFRKVTSSKYIGQDGYILQQCSNGSFSVFKGSIISPIANGFKTIESAETYADRHHIFITCSNDIKCPIVNDDIEFIKQVYLNDNSKARSLYSLNDNYSISVNIKDNEPISVGLINHRNNGYECKTYYDADDLIHKLDSLTNNSILSTCIYRGTDLRSILAVKNNGFNKPNERRRSTKEIIRDIVRVKSSNVWGYGIEIKDRKDKIGDVYIQFKNKNGGGGDVYVYYDVDLNTWRKVLTSSSKGHAVWKYLRNNFMYSKLTGDKRGKLPNAINH